MSDGGGLRELVLVRRVDKGTWLMECLSVLLSLCFRMPLRMQYVYFATGSYIPFTAIAFAEMRTQDRATRIVIKNVFVQYIHTPMRSLPQPLWYAMHILPGPEPNTPSLHSSPATEASSQYLVRIHAPMSVTHVPTQKYIPSSSIMTRPLPSTPNSPHSLSQS